MGAREGGREREMKREKVKGRTKREGERKEGSLRNAMIVDKRKQ